jgi:cellobiose phosphorylase
MKRNINRHAWDGAWYLCALDDDGRPIGSRKNAAGRIFLNTQSWAQLGRVADDRKWNAAWANVLKRLDTGWGLLLNWPTYFKPVTNIGRMSYMRPGTCENGTVYTHGNAFMLMALVERGMADEALRLLGEIAPENPKRPMVNQPNTYYNGCQGPDELFAPGMAEHIWGTGSAAWLYLIITEFILGLRRTYDGMVLAPCMPSAWKTASITRLYRDTTYRVTINNPRGKANAPVESVTVDGRPHPARAPLPIDRKTHTVVVRLA